MVLLYFIKDVTHFPKNIFIFKNKNQTSFIESFSRDKPEFEFQLSEWKVSIHNLMQKYFSAGDKTFCLTESTPSSKPCLCFRHHCTPFQGSGTQDNPPLKLKISKLRWTTVGLWLGFITNSIINHLFPALGITAESNGTFSITASYNIHIFLLFLTGLKV